MTLALVVLALIWVAVLVPPVIRARSEGRPADSISAFRRQLTVLRRTRPGSARALVPDRPRAHAYTSGPAAPVTSLAARRSMVAARSQAVRPVAPRALVAAGLPTSRARTLRRRRDVFIVLLVSAGATLVLSLVPALHNLLYVNLIVDVLLVAYVALLIQQRGARAEQEMKVRFLPRPQPEAMYGHPADTESLRYRRAAHMEPALLRRSAN
jgi:hypothetical protein